MGDSELSLPLRDAIRIPMRLCSPPDGVIMTSSPRTSSHGPMSPASHNCSAVVMRSVVAIALYLTEKTGWIYSPGLG